MVQFIIDLLGITDERYIQYAYYGAVLMLALCTVLVWDGICCIIRSFTRFK